MRRITLFALSIALTFYMFSTADAAPRVLLDGRDLTSGSQELIFDVPPVIQKSQVLVPLRVIFEALGASVQWDETNQTVTAVKDDTEIQLVMDGQAYINGEPVTLTAPARIIDGRTMVPLRFISEAYDCQVNWDGASQTITIVRVPETGTFKANMFYSENLYDASQINEYQINSSYQNAYIKLADKRQKYQTWTIPSQPELLQNAVNALSSGVLGDGATDDTSGIQALLNSVPQGSTVFFPAGRYKISGPVTFAKELTLIGEANTVFDCSTAKRNVFQINPEWSPGSYINNVNITSIEFIGPGLESEPFIIYANGIKNSKISNLKIRDCGYAGVAIANSVDCVIEKCIFENINKTELGYSIGVLNKCDNIYIRDNFFATHGRHGIATGCQEPDPTPDQFPRSIFVINNYFENTTLEAINAHAPTTGPITIKDNVFYNCKKGIQLLNGITEIDDNVFIDCPTGIRLFGDNVPHYIRNNTFINNYWEAIYVNAPNIIIEDNISKGGMIACLSPSDCLIQRNFVEEVYEPYFIYPGSPSIITRDNFAKKLSKRL